MFANGGGANQEFITIEGGRTIPVNVNEFKNQVAGLTDSQVFALAKDIAAGNRQASSAVKQILDQEASYRDVPFLPGQYSFGAFFEDTPRVATKIVGPLARGILGSTTSERMRAGLPQVLENKGIQGNLENITEYDSDLFDTSMSNLTSERNLNIPSYKNLPYPFSEEAADTLFTRGGRSPEELDYGITSLLDVTDDVDSLVGPIRQEPSVISIDEQEDIIEDTPAEREFNLNVRPPKPLSISDFIDEEIKDLTVNVNKTEKESKDEIQKKFIPTLPDIDPNLTQEEADKINKEEKKKEETSSDKKDDDAVTTLANKPGFFGSDNFLNFIRNVGGELVRTGQFGTGLASGAAKAAEERAARELLADQEERKYQREIELAQAKAAATGAKPMPTDKIIELNEKMMTDINEFKGGVAATGFVDLAIETIVEAQESGEAVGGALGWINSFADKVGAFFGAQKEFSELSAQEKVNKLVEVVRQKNLQAILGESGRTISDRDRTIILEVFGDLSLTQDPSITLGKLRESRRGLADNNEKRKRTIATTLPILGQQGTYGQQFFVNLLPIYGEIQGIDPQASQAAAVLQRLLGQNVQSNLTEIGLAE